MPTYTHTINYKITYLYICVLVPTYKSFPLWFDGTSLHEVTMICVTDHEGSSKLRRKATNQASFSCPSPPTSHLLTNSTNATASNSSLLALSYWVWLSTKSKQQQVFELA